MCVHVLSLVIPDDAGVQRVCCDANFQRSQLSSYQQRGQCFHGAFYQRLFRRCTCGHDISSGGCPFSIRTWSQPCVVFQVILVEFGDEAFETKHITWEKWLICLACGAYMLIHYQLVRLIPPEWFEPLARLLSTNKPEDLETPKDVRHPVLKPRDFCNRTRDVSLFPQFALRLLAKMSDFFSSCVIDCFSFACNLLFLDLRCVFSGAPPATALQLLCGYPQPQGGRNVWSGHRDSGFWTTHSHSAG